MKILTPLQKQNFSDAGYLVIQNYLDSKSVSKLRELLGFHIRDTSRKKRTENANLLYVPCISINDPALNQLLKENSLFDTVKSLHNKDIVVVKDEVIIKKAKSVLPSHWHQDHAYFPTPDLVTCLIALDNMNSKSGGYSVIPHSHQILIRHDKNINNGMLNVSPDLLTKYSKQVALNLNPGDLLLLSGHTIHRGLSNSSEIASTSYTMITAPAGYKLEKSNA